MPDPEVPDDPAKRGGGRNLPVAIVTALLLAGLIFGTLFTSRLAWFFVVAAAVLGAQAELYRALASRGFRPATTLGVAGGALIFLGAYDRGPAGVSFGLAATLVGAFVWYVVDPERDRVAENIGATMLGVVYVPFLAAHVTLIRNLPDGPTLTIAYIALVALYDVGAFATGSIFGKRPMAASISPKKTWEGALGATLLVFFLAFLAGPLIDPFDLGSAAALAAATAIAAPLGDLAESLLKRDLGVKDMGTTLPGHGGLLDRIDALLMTAPVAYWLYRALDLS